MSTLRRVPAPPRGDVVSFTMGLEFSGGSPEAERMIRQRSVVEERVAIEIESRLQQGVLSGTLRDAALDYTIGDIRAVEGVTTVDVTIWWPKPPAAPSA